MLEREEVEGEGEGEERGEERRLAAAPRSSSIRREEGRELVRRELFVSGCESLELWFRIGVSRL